jgi:uncharacterized protein YceK
MKKLALVLVATALAGCAATSSRQSNNTTDKTTPYDMTYRGGSL